MEDGGDGLAPAEEGRGPGEGLEGLGLIFSELNSPKSLSKLFWKPKFGPPNSVKVTGPKSGPTVLLKSSTGPGKLEGGPEFWCGGAGAGPEWWGGNLTMVGPGSKGSGFRISWGDGTSGKTWAG